MKTICVFCAANNVPQCYINATETFAQMMVGHGYNLVWGGTDHGLMKVIADKVEEYGGRLIGVTTEMLKAGRRMKADEMIISKDLAARKALLLCRSDALVLMPGGIGSLDEVTEMLELKKHNFHNKTIVVLNTEGFYDGLKMLLMRMKKEGFITKDLNDLIHFADTPQEAMQIIESSH